LSKLFSYIYFSDLNFGKLATGFGLLKLPKMPELRGKDVSDFEEVKVDFNSVPYK
jgi:ATP-dependent RNA helicase DDX55/SPB4